MRDPMNLPAASSFASSKAHDARQAGWCVKDEVDHLLRNLQHATGLSDTAALQATWAADECERTAAAWARAAATWTSIADALRRNGTGGVSPSTDTAARTVGSPDGRGHDAGHGVPEDQAGSFEHVVATEASSTNVTKEIV